MKHKQSISGILLYQILGNFEEAIKSREQNDIDREVRLCININLLLGIVSEGIINEIAENVLDTWTWTEFEKSTTPLKWKFLAEYGDSDISKTFIPSREPLQTIKKLQSIRNKIVHPKSFDFGEEIITVSESKGVLRNTLNDDFIVDSTNVFVRYGKLYDIYNLFDSLKLFNQLILSISTILKIHNFDKEYKWFLDFLKMKNNLKIPKKE